jgi:hypothetical protein
MARVFGSVVSRISLLLCLALTALTGCAGSSDTRAVLPAAAEHSARDVCKAVLGKTRQASSASRQSSYVCDPAPDPGGWFGTSSGDFMVIYGTTTAVDCTTTNTCNPNCAGRVDTCTTSTGAEPIYYPGTVDLGRGVVPPKISTRPRTVQEIACNQRGGSFFTSPSGRTYCQSLDPAASQHYVVENCGGYSVDLYGDGSGSIDFSFPNNILYGGRITFYRGGVQVNGDCSFNVYART